MEICDVKKEVFISATIHQIIDGREENFPVTGFKVPKDGIADIQKFLIDSYTEGRIKPKLNFCAENIRESVLESARNAFFTDICYHVGTMTRYNVAEDEKDISYVE